MMKLPYSVTGETGNLIMLERKLRLPDQLLDYPPPTNWNFLQEYVIKTKDRLDQVHKELRQLRLKIRQDNHKDSLLYTIGDMVWLEDKLREKGDNPKF